MCRVEKCERQCLKGCEECDKHYFLGVSEVSEYFKTLEHKCRSQTVVEKDAVFALRLDGKGFSKVVKNLKVEWPFDKRLSQVMVSTTLRLAKHFSADLGFTMSDEITLVFWKPRNKEKRVFKYLSEVAGLCSAVFYQEFTKSYGNTKVVVPPYFDCRFFQLKKDEVFSMLKWRQSCEVKNSCSNVAFSHYRGSKQKLLNGMSCFQMNTKLVVQKGLHLSWDFYPEVYKYGVFLYKKSKFVSQPPLVKMVNGKEVTLKREAFRNVWVEDSSDMKVLCEDEFWKLVTEL